MDIKSWADKTILIVEDDDIANEFFYEVLKPTRAKLLFVSNGIEAIQICKEKPDIDIILMDMKMPIMDGFETTREIKKINSNIPVIAQTAYAQPKEKTKCLEAGCEAYISKPIITRQLFKIIARLLEKRNN